MGFLMDGLQGEAYDRVYSQRVLIGRIIGYFRPHKWLLLAVAGLIVFNSATNIVLPLLISRGIDGLAASVTAQGAAVLVGVILLAGVLSWTSNFLRQQFTASLLRDVVLSLRAVAFDAPL